MATYKGIQGFKIQSRDGDPDNPIVGDFYYDSTGKKFKVVKDGGASIGTWASGGNLNTARHYIAAARNAPQRASMAFSGYNSGAKNETEKYDGTSWTEVNNLNTSRAGPGGAGTQTAALCMSGTPYSPDSNARTSNVESYDGTNWTEVGDVVTGMAWMGSLGTNTAAMMIGGDSSGGTATANSQTFNGSSWTEGNDLPGAVIGNSSTGTTTAGLNAGAESAPYRDCQTYNGTSWTEVNNTNGSHGYGAMFGTQTAAIITADYPAAVITESWDGTSWTEVADLSTSRYGLAGTGASNAGIAMGGGPSPQNVTEEWTADDYQIKTVTTS